MTTSLNAWQAHQILVLERAASFFSLVGCLFIFLTFLLSHRFRRPINRLIFYASWGNLFMTVASLLSITPMTLPEHPKTAPLCRFQGFLVQMFLPADAFWNLSIAVNVYLTVFKHWDAARLRRLDLVYILINYGLTFAVAFTYLYLDDEGPGGRGRVYGPATLWCWIDDSWEGFRIWLCYAPAWLCIIVVFVIYIFAGIDMHRKRRILEEPNEAMVRSEPNAGSAEVRITTEFKRTSYRTHVPSAHTFTIPEVTSRRLFNPFSLDPTHLQGFDAYSITIERSDNEGEAAGQVVATKANAAAAHAYTRTAFLYFISLLITWLPSSMNRVYSLVHPDQVNFVFSVMAGVVLPLMGFWNSVIYFVTSWDLIVSLSEDWLLKERIAAVLRRFTIHKPVEENWLEIDETGNVAKNPSRVAIAEVRDDVARGSSEATTVAPSPVGHRLAGIPQRTAKLHRGDGAEASGSSGSGT